MYSSCIVFESCFRHWSSFKGDGRPGTETVDVAWFMFSHIHRVDQDEEPSQSASNRKVLERPFPWLHLPVSPSDDMTRGFGNEDYSSTKYDSTTRTNGSTTRSKDTRTENENFNVTKYDPTTRTKDTNFVPDLTP